MLLVLAGAISGCGLVDWRVVVDNGYSEPTIVRVTWDGGSRDVRPNQEEQQDAVHLDVVHPPATVSVLDAATCEVITTAKLPAKTVFVSYGDAFDPDSFGELQIWDWDDPSMGLAPEDTTCVGR